VITLSCNPFVLVAICIAVPWLAFGAGYVIGRCHANMIRDRSFMGL
jgi:hypothetical protein